MKSGNYSFSVTIPIEKTLDLAMTLINLDENDETVCTLSYIHPSSISPLISFLRYKWIHAYISILYAIHSKLIGWVERYFPIATISSRNGLQSPLDSPLYVSIWYRIAIQFQSTLSSPNTYIVCMFVSDIDSTRRSLLPYSKVIASLLLAKANEPNQE